MYSRLNRNQGTSERLAEIESLVEQGQYRHALDVSALELVAAPDQPEVHKLVGRAWQGLGEVERAREAYTQAVQIAPDYAEVYVNLGGLAATQQQWAAAVQYFRQAIAINPSFAGAYRNLARALTQLGEEGASLEAWREALRLEPDAIPLALNRQLAQRWLARGDWELSIGAWRLLLNRDQAYHVEACRAMGEAYQKLGQRDEAEACWRQIRTDSDGFETLSGAVGQSTLAAVESAPANGVMPKAANPLLLPSRPGNVEVQPPADPEALELLAQVYCDRCQWGKAVQFCQSALRVRRSASMFKLLGNALVALGQFALAEAAYQEALRLQPRFAAAYANLGSLYAQQRRWDRSIAAFRRALRLEPQFAGAYRNFAKVWEQVGDEARAVESWYRALGLEPKWATVVEHLTLGDRCVALGETEKAEGCYRRAIALDGSVASAWHRLGLVLRSQDRLVEARVALETALRCSGLPALGLRALADVLVGLEDWTAAIECYGELAAVAPQEVEAQRDFAVLLSERGMQAEVIAVYWRALESMPESFELNLGLAEVLVALEDWDEAIEVYARLAELRPQDGEIQAKLAERLLDLGRVKAAIEVLKRSVAVCDGEAHLHHLLGDALARQEKWKRAVKAYRRAIALRPDFSWSYHNLAEALVRCERLKAAVKAYERAIDLNPEFKWSFFNLGQVLLSLGRFEAAVAAFKRVKKLDPETPWLAKHLGDALQGFAWVTAADAVRWYRRAIDEDPGDLQNYHKALDLQGDDADLYVKLADELARQGQGDGATVFYQMALQLQPDDADELQRLKKNIPQKYIEPSKTQNSTLSRFYGTLTGNPRLEKIPTIEVSKIEEGFIEYDPDGEMQSSAVKLIANYLPQFHPFPENEQWWGKGFTEWTNVGKAKPCYEGHYQPHCPIHFGYYDLRVPSVLEDQAKLARKYGIHGFNFYFYWFKGKTLMEMPIRQFLENQSIDIRFCLTWANENWTRRWDGLENEVLISQEYSLDDSLNLIRHLVPYFKDSRYLKVEGKPIFIVYRVNTIPDISITIKAWHQEIIKEGFPGLYLVAAQAFGFSDPRPYGFDAAMEFPPHGVNAVDVSDRIPNVSVDFQGKIYFYDDIVNAEVKKGGEFSDFKLFKGVTLSWDNTARRGLNSYVFHGFSLHRYMQWLQSVSIKTALSPDIKDDEKLIFVNAWNEWAEGVHLEPDQKYGYGYLEATRRVLKDFDKTTVEWLLNQPLKKNHDVALILHLHFVEVWEEIESIIRQINGYDLYVTTTSLDGVKAVKSSGIDAFVLLVENRGRDILPFIDVFRMIKPMNYKFCCKIHSKRSLHRVDGDDFRRNILKSLFQTKEEWIANLQNRFDANARMGLLVPSQQLLEFDDKNMESNIHLCKELCEFMNIDFSHSLFPAGSMFWFRPKCLEPLLKIDSSFFDIESGLCDGTVPHAIERLFCIVAQSLGYETEPLSTCEDPQQKFTEREVEPVIYVENNQEKVDIFTTVPRDKYSEKLIAKALEKPKSSKNYVICFTERSGSTMLCSILEQTNLLGMPNEYVNPRVPMRLYLKTCPATTLEEYFELLRRTQTTPNGIFGLKSCFVDFKPLIEMGRVGKLLNPVQFIYLTRRDIILQAISGYLARKSGIWHISSQAGGTENVDYSKVEYDEEQILKRIDIQIKERLEWERFFTLYSIEPLRIFYEDIVESPITCVKQILSFLGENTDIPTEDIKSETVKTGGEIAQNYSRRLRERFTL
jgi:tetratricopeptide (TPR) repeat protein/lipopolysaccharide biosynthesis protein/LPS sulfotransferase NodH